jgi:hypothetical protein
MGLTDRPSIHLVFPVPTPYRKQGNAAVVTKEPMA